MIRYTFKDNNNKEWERIDKRAARRLFDQGQTIVIVSDNLRPFGFFSPECTVNKTLLSEWDQQRNDTFDYLVNSFELYNCINCETGYRAAFYKEVK